MVDNTRKTHKERPIAQITTRYLADYMAASEQARRSILRSCKYIPIARVIQHNAAKETITEFLLSPTKNIVFLQEKLESLQAKICDTQFDYDTNQHNCDYVKRFVHVWNQFNLPEMAYSKPKNPPRINLNGTWVIFAPDLLVSRVTRRNTVKVGAVMLRYSKGKPLKDGVGNHQSAFAFGYLKRTPILEGAEPEHKLCLTLDAFSGTAHQAPGNSIYQFNEMRATCEGIAERWPNIQPPPNAVL